jgi:histone acetyltransferase MYST1
MSFKVGQVGVCCLLGKTFKQAELVDRKKDEGSYMYYVHFCNLDRRLDRWVVESDLKLEQDVPEELKPSRSSSNSLTGLPSSSPGLGGLSVPMSPNTRRLTRRESRKNADLSPIIGMDASVSDPLEMALEQEHVERTKIKNIDQIQLGKYLVQTWYFSPFPDEYKSCNKLYFCEFCLKYMRKLRTLQKHQASCKLRHPPGTEIYRHEQHSVFEVDGAKDKLYCQCLCLLSKLFIDHKTLYYDVEPFLFYVLCVYDKSGYHIAGYFSKEKVSADNNNVACILTFPQYQRRGYGRFLIEMSYGLSKIEGKAGSPEKPLSDLGKVSYRSYWTKTLLELLAASPNLLSVRELSEHTGIKKEDIISALRRLELVRYFKGEAIVATDKLQKVIQSNQKVLAKQPVVPLLQNKLVWVPPGERRRNSHSHGQPANSSKRTSTMTNPNVKRKRRY